jgi:hypothetical protein
MTTQFENWSPFIGKRVKAQFGDYAYQGTLRGPFWHLMDGSTRNIIEDDARWTLTAEEPKPAKPKSRAYFHLLRIDADPECFGDLLLRHPG